MNKVAMTAVLSFKSLALADHLLITTYPLVKDPKLLLGVMQHLQNYYIQALPYALQKQGITPLASIRGQWEQLELPGQKLITTESKQAMLRVTRLCEEHGTSPVTFRKKERLVICDEAYGLHTLSTEKVKKELNFAKQLHRTIIGKTND